MVICLEGGADLHMAQLMPLPLAVCCFSKIQLGFTFLVPAHPGSPRQRAVKWVCVCVILPCSYAPTHKFCLGPPMNVGGHHPTYSYDIMLRAARKSWNRDHHVYCDFVSWP